MVEFDAKEVLNLMNICLLDFTEVKNTIDEMISMCEALE